MSQTENNALSTANVRPRRWLTWLALAVAMLLIVVASPTGWLLLRRQRALHDDAVIAELRASPGNLSVNPFWEDGPPWLADLIGDDVLRRITTLFCYAPGNRFAYDADDAGRIIIKRTYVAGVTEDDMAAIGTLDALRLLQLEAHPIDDAGVSHLMGLEQLETLNLSHTKITDAAIESLCRLPNLRHLDISRTDITDACLPDLLKCRRLESLNLESTNFSGEAIKRLQGELPMCKIER